MIYRENKDNDILQKTLFDMFGLPNIIEEDKYNLKITFEYPENDIDGEEPVKIEPEQLMSDELPF